MGNIHLKKLLHKAVFLLFNREFNSNYARKLRDFGKVSTQSLNKNLSLSYDLELIL